MTDTFFSLPLLLLPWPAQCDPLPSTSTALPSPPLLTPFGSGHDSLQASTSGPLHLPRTLSPDITHCSLPRPLQALVQIASVQGGFPCLPRSHWTPKPSSPRKGPWLGSWALPHISGRGEATRPCSGLGAWGQLWRQAAPRLYLVQRPRLPACLPWESALPCPAHTASMQVGKPRILLHLPDSG